MYLAALFGDLGITAPALWAWFASVWAGFAQTAGITLTNSIWQGAVIVFCLEIVLRIIPGVSAAQRFAVWAAAFGVAVGLPLLPLLHFGATVGASTSAGASLATSSPAPLLQLDARWGLAFVGLWALASALRGVDLFVHSLRLRRLWKAAQPLPVSESLSSSLKNVLDRDAEICTTAMLDRPSVIGFLAPRILIPEWLMARLTQAELEQVVLHEAEHLRRRDDWTNLLQKLALVAFPLNPALAWMEHRLCSEREMACDEGVVRITNAPRAYAACLASLAERGLERRAEALSLGAWHRRSELVHRVHGILLRKRGLNRVAAIGLLGTLGFALLAGSVEMARCPQFITFVPKQETSPATEAQRQQLSALVAQETAAARPHLPTGFRAVQAHALMPQIVRAAVPLNIHRVRDCKTVPGPTPSKEVQGKKTPVSKVGPAGNSPQQPAKLDTSHRVIARTEQHWVVLTAWREETVTRTTEITSGTVSDYTPDTAASDNALATDANNISSTADQSASVPSQPAGRYTFTQLILRVVPANSIPISTQPVSGSIRSGWFVIQL